MMFFFFMFLFSDGEREGKSYGEQHLGNNGIVPAAVGVVPGPRGYGVVHGNVDTYFLYKDKVHTGVPCSFLNAKMDFLIMENRYRYYKCFIFT